MKIKDGYYLFYGSVFSNFYPCSIVYKDETYPTSEHVFMRIKAEKFGDFEIAEKILEAKTPQDAKKLGRKVKNYDDVVWNECREQAMYDACFAKFSQNPKLLNMITETKDLIIVEASPFDRIWGIGLGVEDDNATDESKWKGKNLLGKVLMKVREDLKK